MKVVILAGGMGTRISIETYEKPKPMININGKPILWHIMKLYSHFGFNEFVICAGYKNEVIKDYFLKLPEVEISNNGSEAIKIEDKINNWSIDLVDTGINTMTGGRIKRIENFVDNQTFFISYGDTLCDVDIKKLLEFHKQNNAIVSLTAVKPPSQYGVIKFNDNSDVVHKFNEKSKEDADWINGGFFVAEPEIFKLLDNDETVWEKEPLNSLVKDKKLFAYKHYGFWQSIETLKDKNFIEELVSRNHKPWMVWEK